MGFPYAVRPYVVLGGLAVPAIASVAQQGTADGLPLLRRQRQSELIVLIPVHCLRFFDLLAIGEGGAHGGGVVLNLREV